MVENVVVNFSKYVSTKLILLYEVKYNFSKGVLHIIILFDDLIYPHDFSFLVIAFSGQILAFLLTPQFFRHFNSKFLAKVYAEVIYEQKWLFVDKLYLKDNACAIWNFGSNIPAGKLLVQNLERTIIDNFLCQNLRVNQKGQFLILEAVSLEKRFHLSV
jgi:hypothetical protein